MMLSETQINYTLQECVKDVLSNYFRNIGNEDPVDFYSVILEEVERPMLEVLMDRTNCNQVQMANLLGIARGTLRKKLMQYGLSKP
ncbi:MAG: helix-turn-helix domain-containing protein [Gammaproteobacteria bacterium]|nr:helix-turn-helix domain-containing protein [Gammaproteobacteria bacterium]